MKNFISFFLNKEIFKTDGDISTLHEFNKEINHQSALFYPSSGFDINDLFYVNNKRIEEFNDFSPKIHIHADFLHYLDYHDNAGWKELFIYPNFHLTSRFKYFTERKIINIFKIERHNSDEIKWFVFFQGFYNEEVLEALLKSDVKVPIVYALFDGITSGMGFCSTQSIPTILYPLLPTSLGIKFIITEQGWDRVKEILEDEGRYKPEEFRVWLENILLISDNPFISEILKLSDKELIKTLSLKLKEIDEQVLNTSQKMRCYDERFSDVMKLKKIN
jgi:hypothetical protein